MPAGWPTIPAAAIFRTLGDDNRYRVLIAIVARYPDPVTTMQVVTATGLHRTNVEAHLTRLEKHRLIRRRAGARGWDVTPFTINLLEDALAACHSMSEQLAGHAGLAGLAEQQPPA
jgi:DNA-binding transcriptional ArsR family regulator